MLIQTPCPIRTALMKMCKSLLKKKMKKTLSWSSEKIIQWMMILFSISLMKTKATISVGQHKSMTGIVKRKNTDGKYI